MIVLIAATKCNLKGVNTPMYIVGNIVFGIDEERRSSSTHDNGMELMIQ